MLHDIHWHGAKSDITVVRCFGTVSAGLLNRHVVIDGEYYQLMVYKNAFKAKGAG